MTDDQPVNPFKLQRFVDAQDVAFEQALDEVRAGLKRTHWMWFVFPQLAGLGTSEMARRYAISGLDEAHAHLVHSLLGPRYRQIVAALQDLELANAVTVFGQIDAQKLRSSLTLFAAAGEDGLIAAALQRWFIAPDPATLSHLR